MSVQLENQNGTPVDPVPFLVVSSAAFLLCFSGGPMYLLALGTSEVLAMTGPAVPFLATAAFAYHRYVWTARPDIRGDVPVGLRFQRLVLGAVIVGVLFLGLSLLSLH